MNAVVFEGFDDITKDDILKAIEKYDELEKKGELNTNRVSTDYKLIYNGKEYPPKYIMGIAYEIKYGAEPDKYGSTGSDKK